MRPKAFQQQDLSKSMAHQEGYKDSKEKGTSNRLERPVARSGKDKKKENTSKQKKKATKKERHIGQQQDRQKNRHSVHLLTKCRRNSPNRTGAAEARQNEDALTHKIN